MLPKLQISVFLLKRLEQVKQQCSGCLYGVFYDNSMLMLMSFNVETSLGQLNYEQIQQKLPAELDLCGLVKFGDCTDTEAHLHKIFKNVFITDNPILLHCELNTLVGLKAMFLVHGKLLEVPYKVIETDQLYRDFCFTRLRCYWTIYTETTPRQVKREMERLRQIISGGNLAFNVKSTKIYVTNNGVYGSEQSITNENAIEDIINHMRETFTGDLDSTKTKNGNIQYTNSKFLGLNGVLGLNYDIINVEVLYCKTGKSHSNDDTFKTRLTSMTMCLRRKETKCKLPIEMETMAILSKKTKVLRLYDILIESLCRALKLTEFTVCEHLIKYNSQKQLALKMYSFAPQELGHFVLCCYLDDISDDNIILMEQRKRLHKYFGLSITRPYFRRSNVCKFLDELCHSGSPLLNVHIGIGPSDVTDRRQYVVQGHYRYYHYLQQQVQDKGWGCAYRSFQTIFSWFQLQGYTNQPIPTHSAIQEYLVKIGDKPESFKGSSHWIGIACEFEILKRFITCLRFSGSLEISLCLQGFLNVESKILHVTSGVNISTIAVDMALHFQVQGTPIMIGGGVLAHTIIGIDFCTQPDEIKFLILDPHYTGHDDLNIIQSKGWCGWKKPDFWDKRCYYNVCMPQRPIIY